MDAAVDKRMLILDAALALFTERGFHGTAVPDIARAAGVGTGTIYRYFPDKEGLVNALYRTWRKRFNAAVLAPMPSSLSPREQFERFWQRLAGWVRDAPLAARFLELHPHEAYLDEPSRQVARAYPAAVRNFVRSGISSGVLAPMAPEVAAALMQGTIIGLMKQSEEAARTGRDVFRDEVIADAGAGIWRAIASVPDAA